MLTIDQIRQMTAPMFVVEHDGEGRPATVGWSDDMVQLRSYLDAVDVQERATLRDKCKKERGADWRQQYLVELMTQGKSGDEFTDPQPELDQLQAQVTALVKRLDAAEAEINALKKKGK